MRKHRARRRPALLPCLALLAGVAVAHLDPPQLRLYSLSAAATALLVAAAARRRGAEIRWSALSLSLLCCGFVLAGHDEARRQDRRTSVSGGRTDSHERHVEGRVLRLAEPTFDDQRILLLRVPVGRKTGEAEGTFVLRLTVRASPTEPTALLDSLRTGDRVRVWCRIHMPRALGNPGAIDPTLALASRGLDFVGSVKSARLVELVAEDPGRARFRIDDLKTIMRGRLDRIFEMRSAERALAGAMLLGDRAALDPPTLRRLRDAGLIHLVAISGLHVGLLGLLWTGILARMGLPRTVRLLLTGLFLHGFGQTVGLRPSVLRAALSGVTVLAGRAIGRDGDGVNTLAWIAAGLVVLSPVALLHPGLQLTFAATAGILLAAARPGTGASLPGWFLTAGRISSGAYLATAPLVAWHFGRLAPISLATNLVAVPLCGLMLTGGYAAIALLPVPVLGPTAAGVARAASSLLLDLSRLASGLDQGSLALPGPSWILLGAYYGLGTTLCAGRLPSRGARRIVALGFATCVLWLHTGPPPPLADASIEAAAIDVGQGQAIAVRGPDGGVMLVDAAGGANPRFDPGERIVLPFLLSWSGPRLEALVLSHDHLDHAGGAEALLRELEVGQLCLPPGYHRSSRFRRLAHLALGRGVALRLCERGQRILRATLDARVLGPARDDAALAVNDRSVSVLVGSRPHRLLIPGDLGRAGERALIERGGRLRAEALILSHHGSRTGSSRRFLDRVGPTHAVVSCGYGNRFGHPAPAACARVRRVGARLWRTDTDGMVLLRAGRGGWKVTAVGSSSR